MQSISKATFIEMGKKKKKMLATEKVITHQEPVYNNNTSSNADIFLFYILLNILWQSNNLKTRQIPYLSEHSKALLLNMHFEISTTRIRKKTS